MSDNHTALLVEDEPEMAEEFTDLITSLGHRVVHTESQEGAQALIQAERICYAVVDLQIKVSGVSVKPKVEAGQNLILNLRNRFPRRNDRDHHHFPILVTSGHAKDAPSVLKAVLDGGNNFVFKPLSDNKQPLGDIIRDALHKSGRDAHDRCKAATALSLRDPAPTPARGWTELRLDISGNQMLQRWEVRMADRSAHLTTASFILLLKLVEGRLREGDGWVHKAELGAKSDVGWKGAARLRTR